MSLAKINLGGKEYPCRETMGAITRYKHETGKDISTLCKNDLNGLVIFLWCCVCSACKADKVEFNLSSAEFADYLDVETLNAFIASLAEANGDKKKVIAK